MKKLLIIALMLALFLQIIEARVINITKTDFYIEPRQIYRLEQGDGISFLKENKEYIVSIDEIGKNGIRLKSFAYKEDGERETFYILLNERYSNKIDFEKDDIYDMQLNLVKIWNLNDTTKADILFEALNETKPQDNTNKSENKLNDVIIGSIIAVLIVIIGLIIYFVLKKNIKTKKG